MVSRMDYKEVVGSKAELLALYNFRPLKAINASKQKWVLEQKEHLSEHNTTHCHESLTAMFKQDAFHDQPAS